ncbi:protein of unknown function [Cupriavidus taiwanensis]|nr:protein of unknown function [Cupriavidus taiwanensis]
MHCSGIGIIANRPVMRLKTEIPTHDKVLDFVIHSRSRHARRLARPLRARPVGGLPAAPDA